MDMVDDRFDPADNGRAVVAAVGWQGAIPVAYLGGDDDAGPQQHLEAVVADAVLGPDAAGDILVEAYDRLATELATTTPPTENMVVWGRPWLPHHDHLVEHRRLRPLRALHQLRSPLPATADPLPTRSFRPGIDDAELLAVNNRAFAHHPDQGRHTLDTLRALFDEPWFRPEGLRLYHDPAGGRLAGFCWTKIHYGDDPERALGEIYVIGIDPDYHGRGLGVPMTASGLVWLADHGLTTAMLYVEADNAPALATYERLGFERHHTDRAFVGEIRAGEIRASEQPPS